MSASPSGTEKFLPSPELWQARIHLAGSGKTDRKSNPPAIATSGGDPSRSGIFLIA